MEREHAVRAGLGLHSGTFAADRAVDVLVVAAGGDRDHVAVGFRRIGFDLEGVLAAAQAYP